MRRAFASLARGVEESDGFMAVRGKPRYRVLRVVKDWETGTAYHGGDVLTLTGAETQAFLHLLRWAEGTGRVQRIET